MFAREAGFCFDVTVLFSYNLGCFTAVKRLIFQSFFLLDVLLFSWLPFFFFPPWFIETYFSCTCSSNDIRIVGVWNTHRV